MDRSLTSSLTALNAPAKQAQMTRMSSSEEASLLIPLGAACAGTVAWAEGRALALPDAGALAGAEAGALAGAAAGELAWPEAGALAGAEADGLACAPAGAWPTCCAATACGDGCDLVWLAEGLGLALGLAP